jgi:beta-glucosidase
MSDLNTHGDASQDLPADRRVESLLDEMSTEEKAGQLVGTFVGDLGSEHRSLEEVESLVRDGTVGSVSPFGVLSSPYSDPTRAATVANRLQRVARTESRLGIPLFVPVDAVHGHAYVADATVFPHNLGMAATRDPDLVRRVARCTTEEVAATGGTQNYAPTCDVARDPRWGRTYETFGESPYLCGVLAAAEVAGAQAAEASVLTTAKHFPAYSDPSRGEDAAVVDRSPGTLHRVFLPPFRAAIEAGADTVMPSYSAVGAAPAHGSQRYLSDLLRGELSFDGPVVSDWNGVEMLHDGHEVTDSLRGSVERATRAGIDVASVGGPAHADCLADLVEDGAVPEDRLDESVRRVLAEKVRLGLFEDPYVDAEAVETVLGTDEHRAVAREAAQESVTLVDNEGLLPLSAGLDEILVTGPNADDLLHQVGGWSVVDEDDVAGTTIYGGIDAAAGPETDVVYEPGTGITERVDVPAARQAAADADVAVVALGENWYIHEFGPAAQAGDADAFPARSQLQLPDAQRGLLRAVAGTGTPTVLVVVSGRPLAVPWAAENLSAVLYAYYPGSEGGGAVADILFGDVSPSGTLPVSVPRSTGHLPTRFNYTPHPHPISDPTTEAHPASYDPLYEFGHGLTYTEFEYEDLSLSTASTATDGVVGATVTVRNVGRRAGTETVHLYVSDPVSSRVTPVRELRGVARVPLEAGERAAATLSVDVASLGVVDDVGEPTVEPGRFDVRVGPLSESFVVESGPE